MCVARSPEGQAAAVAAAAAAAAAAATVKRAAAVAAAAALPAAGLNLNPEPPLPPPWKLVSPDGVLHLVADDKALVAFSHAHNLTTHSLRQMLGFSKNPLRSHKGWRAPERRSDTIDPSPTPTHTPGPTPNPNPNPNPNLTQADAGEDEPEDMRDALWAAAVVAR